MTSVAVIEMAPGDTTVGPTPIKDAKRRVLQSLSGSGAATVIEIVTGTALPFDLASVVIGDLETEGKVTVKVNDGLKWVELKK
jgi:hypothetical protein